MFKPILTLIFFSIPAHAGEFGTPDQVAEAQAVETLEPAQKKQKIATAETLVSCVARAIYANKEVFKRALEVLPIELIEALPTNLEKKLNTDPVTFTTYFDAETINVLQASLDELPFEKAIRLFSHYNKCLDKQPLSAVGIKQRITKELIETKQPLSPTILNFLHVTFNWNEAKRNPMRDFFPPSMYTHPQAAALAQLFHQNNLLCGHPMALTKRGNQSDEDPCDTGQLRAKTLTRNYTSPDQTLIALFKRTKQLFTILLPPFSSRRKSMQNAQYRNCSN